jgi:hypothetical protein
MCAALHHAQPRASQQPLILRSAMWVLPRSSFQLAALCAGRHLHLQVGSSSGDRMRWNECYLMVDAALPMQHRTHLSSGMWSLKYVNFVT